MIKVTRINRIDKFWINENLIEFMEETPDTMLSMLSGRKVNIAETTEEILELISKARRAIIIERNELEEAVE